MKPIKGRGSIDIPMTVTPVGARKTGGKWFASFLLIVIWLFLMLVLGLTLEGAKKGIVLFLVTLSCIYIFRFGIIREHYYRKKRETLMQSDYLFDHDLFWSILDMKTIAHLANGIKAVYIAFDKDVVVGKDDDDDFYHYEAIANAYKKTVKSGIECIHIDLMDTVGKDTRLVSMFSLLDKVVNEDIKKVLFKKYDYIEKMMNRSYATYDVYAFYYTGDDAIFWEDLQSILSYFRQANYIRLRLLNKEEVGIIAESLFNLDEFSINNATNLWLKKSKKVNYLRPIWVEKDGERKVLNKTTEEINQEKKVLDAERRVKSKKGKMFSKEKDADIDL
ncbi:hypothetical protein D3C71_1347170 [compost metagenome]